MVPNVRSGIKIRPVLQTHETTDSSLPLEISHKGFTSSQRFQGRLVLIVGDALDNPKFAKGSLLKNKRI